MLHHAGQVAEAQVDELHLLGAHQLQDLVRRSVFHGGAPYFQEVACELGDDQGRQAAQLVELVLVEQPRPVVAHAEGADPAAVGEHQRDAGVEADAGRTGDRRVVGEPVVLEGVGHRRARRRRGWRARTSTGPAGLSVTSNPRCDLNHCRSASTSVTSAIGVSVACRARSVYRSNRASGGVSRMSSECRAARRCSSSAGSGAASQRHARRSTAARSLVRTWAIEQGSTSQSVTCAAALRDGAARGAEHVPAAGEVLGGGSSSTSRTTIVLVVVVAELASPAGARSQALGRRPRPARCSPRTGSLVASDDAHVEVLEGRARRWPAARRCRWRRAAAARGDDELGSLGGGVDLEAGAAARGGRPRPRRARASTAHRRRGTGRGGTAPGAGPRRTRPGPRRTPSGCAPTRPSRRSVSASYCVSWIEDVGVLEERGVPGVGAARLGDGRRRPGSTSCGSWSVAYTRTGAVGLDPVARG